MMILITGGSRSGKSSLGERLLSDWNGRRLYLATMMPRGEESARAIERHRVMRAGKGFETVERYTDVGALSLPDGCGVLLECMGNLLANEMFEAGEPDPCGKIIADVRRLSERAGRLIVITNQVDSDGMDYPRETSLYIQHLGKINASLAASSCCVIESVYGIPVPLKGGLPPCL